MAGVFRMLQQAWRPAVRTALLSRIEEQATTGMCGVLFTQQRWKNRPHARARKAAVARANKRRKDALKEAMPPEPKVKVTNAPEDPDIKYAGRKPEDDVWIQKYYPTPRYSLVQAVQMHREVAAPEVTNNLDGKVFLSCTLDLRMKKKNKFMKEFSQTVVLPHFFDDGTTHRIMIFCKEAAERELAKSLGAEICGGLDLVKAMTRNEVPHDDYDHVICTTDMFDEIGNLRKILRDRFPNSKENSVGDDVGEMFKHFTEGKTYKMQVAEDSVADGKIELPICTLRMTDEEAWENFQTFLEKLYSLKKTPVGPHGPFLKRCVVRCPPSKEQFVLDEDFLIPDSLKEKEDEGSDTEGEAQQATSGK